MKSKRTKIILAASAAALVVAGLITFFVLKNRHKPGEFEVKFALSETASAEDRANTKLPETVKVKEGTTIGTLATPRRDGALFMNWTYDQEGNKRANSEDPITSNLTLYPRFVKQQGLSNITGFTYVSKLDVPADYEVELISYGLTRSQVEKLISLTNESRAGEKVPFVLVSLREEKEREWLTSVGLNSGEIKAVWECVEKSESREAGKTLLQLLEELAQTPGISLDEAKINEISTHFAPASTVSVSNSGGELDDRTLAVLSALGIDFATVTEADLLERYGLDADDSVERFWRENVGLSVEEVLTLEQYLYADKTLRGDRWLLHYGYGEWEGGELYSVTLSDTEKLRFVYEGEPTAREVTEYNLRAVQEEVKELTVDERVIHVPASEVEGVEFRGVLTLETDENGGMTATENTGSGTLIYSGSEKLENGVTVAVHKGAFTEDGLSEGDVAYVKIVRGYGDGRYEFEYAGLDSILSSPNVIPIADDGSFSDGKVIVDDNALDFRAAAYREFGLSEKSVIKNGDIVCFYTGKLGGSDFSEKAFGKITGIVKNAGKTEISYEKIEEEELTAPETVLYTTLPPITFTVTDEDQKRIEEEMKKQVYESGIVGETKELFAMLLAGDEVDFDSFEHGDELRNMTINTDGADMTLEDIRKLSGGSSKVEVEGFTFQFSMSPVLSYLGGTGLRGEAAVSFKITITIGDNGGTLEIVPAIILEQEVKLTPSIKVKRNKNRIGLTSSLDITASLDAGTYTGFGVVVTAQTKMAEGEEENKDFASMVGGFIDNGDASTLQGRTQAAKALITAGDAFTAFTNLEKMKEQGAGYQRSQGEDGQKKEQTEFVSPGLGGGLAEKYSNMLGNDAEYIPLVDVDLASVDLPIDPCGIIHVGLKINFNVSLKINAMIGAGLSYENEKLYSYAFRAKIWGGGDEFNKIGGFQEGSSVKDIKTSCFRADFYAFGMIGLRAGVSLDVRVGVFSTDLDSVGIVASAGIYAELYGFLYVHYELKAGEPAKSGASGSLYFEIGIYTDIDIKVQVAAGAASKSWSIYSSTIPLVKLGCEAFPLDFAIEPGDERLTVTIPSSTNTVKIDSDIFKMKLMEMKSGEEIEENEDSKVVNTEDGTEHTAEIVQPKSETNGLTLSKSRSWTQYNEENFTVECYDLDENGKEISGPSSFQYLPGTNEIFICPLDTTKTKFKGKVVFTYRNHAFGFSTEKIQRTVYVSWEGTVRSARVEYYREVSTLGAFELVGTGSVTGLENAYCYVAVTQELCNLYPGYRLDYLRYPDEEELKKRYYECGDEYGELLTAVNREKDLQKAGKLADQLRAKFEELGILSSLYTQYKETNEEAIRKRDGSNTYFTLRGSETVVGVYFRREAVNTHYMIYDAENAKFVNYESPLSTIEVLNTYKILDSTPEVLRNFNPDKYDDVKWYIRYVPDEIAAVKGNGGLFSDIPAVMGEVRNGDLSGLTPITADTVMESAKGHYATVVGIPIGKEHTVHWMEDENEISTSKVRFLDEVSLPEAPKKDGCEFAGWEFQNGMMCEKGFRMENNDVYLNAVYSGNEVKVTWITDNGQKAESVIHVNDRIYLQVPEEINGGDGLMMIWRTEKDNPRSTIAYDYRMDNRSEVTFYGRPGIGFSALTWIDGDKAVRVYTEIGTVPVCPLGNEKDIAWKFADGTVMQKEFLMPRRSLTVTAFRHQHVWSEEIAKVMPTCKSAGHEGRVCSVCGLIEDGTILPADPNAHVWADYEVTPATCSEEGVMGRQCDYCVAVLEGYAEPIAKNPENHTHTELRGEREPSCVRGYTGDLYCADCGELLETGHGTTISGNCIYTHEEGVVEPTCTEPGNPGRIVCDDCGRICAAYSYLLPPLGHDGVLDPEKSREATCEEDGIRVFTCSRCSLTWEEIIPAYGHEWQAGEIVKQPSCKNGLIMRFRCSVCNKEEDVEIGEPFEHHYINETIVKEASCSAEGLKRSVCEYCGDVKEEVIPKNGDIHRWDAGKVTKQESCKEEGVKTFTCLDCGKTFTQPIEKTRHKWEVDRISKEPTCKEEGIRVEKCIECGETQEIPIPIDTSNHVHLGEPETVLAAGCVSEGIEKCICKDCGAEITRKTPALGHDYTEAKYEWSADNKTVTATISCRRDHSHDIKENVKTTAKVTKEPTATTMGDTTYTATFKSDVFKTQTRTVTDIEKVDESWNPATYTWSNDNSTVTAKRTRRSDASISETETVSTTVQETKKAGCDEDGENVYTAVFQNPNFSKQVKSVTVPKFGHDWQTESTSTEPELIIGSDGTGMGWRAGVKKLKCSRCGEEKNEKVKASMAGMNSFGDVCTYDSPNAMTFDLSKCMTVLGWPSLQEVLGPNTPDEPGMSFAGFVAEYVRIVSYNDSTKGWWKWSEAQKEANYDLYSALFTYFPEGRYDFADENLAGMAVAEFTGDKAVIKYTVVPMDPDNVQSLTMTVTILFPKN
ncbi:MAG: InlB B-repeat-containing protein [Lachnospiraceae bacterium]|nr:InlB B-repeat-containing protein [Lachnospiraceae bacterium]